MSLVLIGKTSVKKRCQAYLIDSRQSGNRRISKYGWALSARRTNEIALAGDAQKERSLPDRQSKSKPDGNVIFSLLYSPLDHLFTVIVLIFGTIWLFHTFEGKLFGWYSNNPVSWLPFSFIYYILQINFNSATTCTK